MLLVEVDEVDGLVAESVADEVSGLELESRREVRKAVESSVVRDSSHQVE